MRRQRHRWAGGLAITATLLVLLGIGRLSAQAPALLLEERLPQLFSSPDGRMFRLWNAVPDAQRSGPGFLLALASPPNTWQTLLEIFPGPGLKALDPGIAIGSSQEVAVAYQWYRENPRAKQIRVASSYDGGNTWVQPSTAVESSNRGFAPKLAWGRGRSLVVAWADERAGDNPWNIYARRSPDGGSTWEPEQLLSRFPQGDRGNVAFAPGMVLSDDQDRFWVVWRELRNLRSNVYLSRSIDGGRTWTDPQELSGQGSQVLGEQLVRSGERLLLVWADGRVGGAQRRRLFSATSADGGVTWSAPIRVDHVPADSMPTTGIPAVALGQDQEVFVTWYDGRNGRFDIFLGRSPDFGRTWDTKDIRLDMDDPGTAASRWPAIARAEDGRLVVAWEDERAGYEGIYLRVRSAGPSPAWGPEVVVAPPGPKKAARIPSVRWGRDGALYVAWETWVFEPGTAAVTKGVDGRVLFPDKK